MQSLIEIISRQLSARDRIKGYLKKINPFRVDFASVQRMSIGELPVGYLVSDFGTAVMKMIRGLDTRLLFAIGTPGLGKTNLLRFLCYSSMCNGDKCLIISRKGWEFSGLLNLRKDFYDLKTKDIRLNPFYPPIRNISRKEWNTRCAQAISSFGWLKYASGTNLEKILDAYTENFPDSLITPSKLVQYIVQRKSYKLIQVDERVRNRMEALNSGEGTNVFDTNQIIDFEFYAANNINFDLSSLSANQVGYFISIFLEMLTTWKLYTKSKQRHCIILDDYSDLVDEMKDSM